MVKYLKMKNPFAGKWEYWIQMGPIYGEASAPVRWESTIAPWLVEQGFTLPSKLYCPRHACQTDGCTRSKPSADSFCNMHQSILDGIPGRMRSFAEEHVAEPSRGTQYAVAHARSGVPRGPARTAWVPPAYENSSATRASLTRSSNV